MERRRHGPQSVRWPGCELGRRARRWLHALPIALSAALGVACVDGGPSTIHYFGPGEEPVTWARWRELCGHGAHCVLRAGQTLIVDREWTLMGRGCREDVICIVHEGEAGGRIVVPAPLGGE